MGCDDENAKDVRDADEEEEVDMLEGEDVRGRMLKKEDVEMVDVVCSVFLCVEKVWRVDLG